MAIREIVPRRIPDAELAGTVWADVAKLNIGHRPARTNIVPVVPQNGAQTVKAAAGVTHRLSGEFRVTALQLDIPKLMQADIIIDGRTVLSVDDGQGKQGGFPLSTGHGSWMDVQTVEVVVHNDDSVDNDVGVWLVVV